MGLPPIDCGLERDASGVSEAAHQQLCIDDASEMYNAHRKEAYRAMRTRFCVEHIVCPEAGGGNKSGCSRRRSSALPPSFQFHPFRSLHSPPQLTAPPYSGGVETKCVLALNTISSCTHASNMPLLF